MVWFLCNVKCTRKNGICQYIIFENEVKRPPWTLLQQVLKRHSLENPQNVFNETIELFRTN